MTLKMRATMMVQLGRVGHWATHLRIVTMPVILVMDR